MKSKLELLKKLSGEGYEYIKEARENAKTIKIPPSAWCKAHGYASEKAYKEAMAKEGKLMYHTHFCFPDNQTMKQDMKALEEMLDKQDLTLDRYGMSLDPSMALPKELRDEEGLHNGLYFRSLKDWEELSSFSFTQPHLGDNMIGSPASYDSCLHALRSGVTTMGNLSQFFGWDYPEYTDVAARTRSTVMAMAAMAEHVDDGALIHSNLDDGYGASCDNMEELIGMALLEQYIVEELLGAKVAHSYGDLFPSPYERLVFLSALKQIHGEEVFGSMVFTNKVGRAKEDISLNDAHLCTCLLYDMAGQLHYKTGHAVTVMADRGLDDQVTMEEIVRKLALAKQLESYLPEVLKSLDFHKIDEEAARIVAGGEERKKRMLETLSQYIDEKDPYQMLLAVKILGVKALITGAVE